MEIKNPLILSLLISPVLSAATILDSGSIEMVNFNANDTSLGVVATSTFNLAPADIQKLSLELNFIGIDAGLEVFVNGASLFSTGFDVSQHRPANTGFEENINDPFNLNGNTNGIPRLTVTADNTGTSFSGSEFLNSTAPITYTPTFTVANFQSLLVSGANTIQIANLNNFQGAALVGDYEVATVHPETVPEPTSIALLGLGGLVLVTRRKR